MHLIDKEMQRNNEIERRFRSHLIRIHSKGMTTSFGSPCHRRDRRYAAIFMEAPGSLSCRTYDQDACRTQLCNRLLTAIG